MILLAEVVAVLLRVLVGVVGHLWTLRTAIRRCCAIRRSRTFALRTLPEKACVCKCEETAALRCSAAVDTMGLMAMQGHRAERGFTLLEMMAVVAIIAILAAVVIPYFFGETRKAKGKTEVTAMFGELSTKQEQFKVDWGLYFPFAGGPTTACPATTTGQAQDVTVCPTTAWNDAGSPPKPLRVLAPQSTVLCSYTLTSGPSTTAPAPPAGFNMVLNQPAITPAGAWYFIVATCDLDGQGGLNTMYFTSSMDATLQIQNEGK